MTLDEDVLDSLGDLKYPAVESLTDENGLKTDELVANVEKYSGLVSWLANQIKSFLRVDSVIDVIQGTEDWPCFLMEVNSLLRELGSPYVGVSLEKPLRKLGLVHSLCGQLLSVRILAVKDPKYAQNGAKMTIEMEESETAKDLKVMVTSVGLGKPPPNISSAQLFNKLRDKINERVAGKGLNIEGPLLLEHGMTLSPQQWERLEQLQNDLHADYSLRRETLLTRCDCTVGSFKWKAAAKDKLNDSSIEKKVDDVYNKIRPGLQPKSRVTLADALASRQSDCDALLNAVVTSTHQQCDITAPETRGQANKGLQQRLSLQKFIIGNVPDRGGRPDEQKPPTQESFEQQQNQREQSQRGGRGRGGGGRGGAVGGGGGHLEGGGQRGRGGGGGGGNSSQYKDTRVQGTGWNQTGDQRSHGGNQYSSQPQQYAGGQGGHFQPQPRHYVDAGQQVQFQPQYTSHPQYSGAPQYSQQQSQYNDRGQDAHYNQGYHQQQDSREYRRGAGRAGGGGGGGRRGYSGGY